MCQSHSAASASCYETSRIHMWGTLLIFQCPVWNLWWLHVTIESYILTNVFLNPWRVSTCWMELLVKCQKCSGLHKPKFGCSFKCNSLYYFFKYITTAGFCCFFSSLPLSEWHWNVTNVRFHWFVALCSCSLACYDTFKVDVHKCNPLINLIISHSF